MLTLVIASLGLPINELVNYGLVVVAVVFVFTGTVTARLARWLAATALVAVAIIGQWFVASPRIEEGHNIFVVYKPNGALEQQLPPAVFRVMLAEFDALYPAEQHCLRADICWRGGLFPDRPYAFSADAVFQKPAFSRRVTGIDFDDPIWLRLAAINDLYNWYEERSDVQRRERRPFDLAHPWQLLMPWYVTYRFPPAFNGSTLCWRGEVLWEKANEEFDAITHAERSCKTLGSEDIGKRIFGVAIRNEFPLAMTLEPPASVRLRVAAERCLAIGGALAALLLLTTVHWRRAVLPMGLLALGAVGITLQDSSFFAGLAPQGAGGDGLYYEAMGRKILENFLVGRYADALSGGVAVFYANPGMSYLHALERVFVGDTNFGYTTLLLVLPYLTYRLSSRFLPRDWAVAAAIVLGVTPMVTSSMIVTRDSVLAAGLVIAFVAALAWFRVLSIRWAVGVVAVCAVLQIFNPYGEQVSSRLASVARGIVNLPIRAVDQFSLEFGRWTVNAMEGFGDAASFVIFTIGFLLLVGKPMAESGSRVVHAFGAALLMVLAVSIRPPLAVMVGIMLGSAGLACLYWRHYARLAAMCLGFAPIALIPLHNWYFGGVFVLLSTNAAAVTVMTPADVVAALGELARLDLWGSHLHILMKQILIFLSTRAGGPLKLIAIVILLLVIVRRQYDPWLRVTAIALIAQGIASLFFVLDRRYLILNWYLTGLIVAVWLNDPDTRLRISRVANGFQGWWQRLVRRKSVAG